MAYTALSTQSTPLQSPLNYAPHHMQTLRPPPAHTDTTGQPIACSYHEAPGAIKAYRVTPLLGASNRFCEIS